MTCREAIKLFAEICKRDGTDAVAQRIGCSVSYVTMIRDGIRKPAGDIGVRVEDIYEIPYSAWRRKGKAA